MKLREIRQLPGVELDSLLVRIPFLKELRQRDEEQLQLLLGYSCLVELAPGETIMRRGEKGSWLYFLLKGELEVYRDEPEPGRHLSTITPGELFGDLALLCNLERKATVAAPASRGATLFACDFAPFGTLDQFSRVSLGTKILLYRTVLHSVRWRLEVNRMRQPRHPLVQELLRVPVYAGCRDGIEELHALDQQAQALAALLERWNQGEGSGDTSLMAAPAPRP